MDPKALGQFLMQPSTADVLNTPVRRGGILPVTEYPNRTEFDLSSGLTGALMDAFTAPARAARGEISESDMVPEAFNFAGSLTLGSLLAPRPTGSVGMGGRAKALDMSEAARMARAKEMGFGGEMYHGSPDFRGVRDSGQFEARTTNRFNNQTQEWESVPQPVYFSKDRAVAKTYANDSRAFDYQNAEPEVMAAMLRSGKTLELNAGGSKFSKLNKDQIRQQLPEAEREQFDNILNSFAASARDNIRTGDIELIASKLGYDGFRINNVLDTYTGGEKPTTIEAVFDPARIRSVNAAFDPDNAHLANLLAANAKTGAAIPLATKALEAQQPQGIRAFHGSPHNYKAERLIEWPDGRTEYIEGLPDVLPDVPTGAKVLKDFPLGRQRMDKIGTGEGAQAFGHGLYEAGAEGTAQNYKTALAGRGLDPKDVALRHDLPESVSADLFNAIHHGKDDPLEAAKAVQMKNAALRDEGSLMNVGPKRRQIAKAIEDGRNLSKGHMYEVRINADPADFLDWDKPLSQQSEKVRNAVLGSGLAKTPFGSIDTVKRSLARERGILHEAEQELASNRGMFGRSKLSADQRDTYARQIEDSKARIDEFERILAGDATASYLIPQHGDTAAQFSSALREAGIPGIRYLDQMSRGKGEGSSNYVVFDDSLIEILRKYGLLGPVAGGGTLAGMLMGGQEGETY